MNSDSVVIVESFPFGNNADGFCTLVKKIDAFDKADLFIGLESTGIYSEKLICFLFDKGYNLAVINLIQTATLRKTAIRKTNTDKVDTFLSLNP